MPTFLNPFKSSFIAPPELRLAWLREIFAEYEDVTVSEYEVNLGKKTPSIQTVEHLLHNYEKVYLVIGADNLASLNSWYKFEELKKRVTFIVASRDDIEIPFEYIKLSIDEDVSSSMLRKKIDTTKLPKLNALKIEQYYKEHNAR